MKLLNKIIPAIVLLCMLVSCEKSPNRDKNLKEEVSKEEVESDKKEDLAKVEVAISGMTCEIGCAKLIQSKLYKTDGVKEAKVVFVDSVGLITYDRNRVSKDDLKQVIERTAGGDLYSVVELKDVELVEETGQ